MIRAAAKPAVTVVHSLPGRVRMRLSRPPVDVQGLIGFVREHPGMGPIHFTGCTGSLVVCFDPHAISLEEITMRTAFRYAIDQGNRPVRLLAAPEHAALQNSAVLSGIGVLTALGLRWLAPSDRRDAAFGRLAGLATAWSVLDHGWRELRGRGYFDPEVVTVAYLARALVRGNALAASMVTWAATFGRHLVEMSSTAVLVEPVAVATDAAGAPRYELVVGPDSDAPDRLPRGVVSFVNGALRYAMTGGGTHGLRSFWEELRDMSRIHGEVLEGYGSQRDGIPVRFRRNR